MSACYDEAQTLQNQALFMQLYAQNFKLRPNGKKGVFLLRRLPRGYPHWAEHGAVAAAAAASGPEWRSGCDADAVHSPIAFHSTATF